MDRRFIAYLLIAALVAAVAVLVVRWRYNSRPNVLKRQRHADAARRTAKSRRNEEDDPPAG